MQNFAAIGPFGAEIWRGGGGQIDPPPPSKNLFSKSPVKIGLNAQLATAVARGGGHKGAMALCWSESKKKKSNRFVYKSQYT